MKNNNKNKIDIAENWICCEEKAWNKTQNADEKDQK